MAGISYKYWAFISYSHYDIRAARWLKEALARQLVPRRFRRLVTPTSRRFESIFFDESHASAGPSLGGQFEEALRASRHLIILASPFAVVSPHVEREIAYFVSLGRLDRVVCLVASGLPNATDAGQPALECFPRPLRVRVLSDGQVTDEVLPLNERPLAATLGQETAADQKQATEKIVAGLLGISLEELRQQRQNRALWMGTAWAAVALFASAVPVIYWDRTIRLHRSYYEESVRRGGTWEGIGSLSRGEAAHRASYLEFERKGRGGPVMRVRLLNGSGGCPEPGLTSVLGETLQQECSARRACEATFTDDSGRLDQSERLWSQFGENVEVLKYVGQSVALFVEAEFPCNRGKTGVNFVRFTRVKDGPQQGFDERIEYLREDKDLELRHLPHPNSQGVFGFQYERDDTGRVRRTYGLGPNGGIGPGQAYEETIYDAGLPRSVSYLGQDRRPLIIARHGYAKYTNVFDARRNTIGQDYFGIDGKPILSRDGYAGWRSKHDDRGNVIEGAYFGVNGEPIISKDGYAGWRQKYDDHGNVVEGAYIGIDGKPILSKNGYAGWRAKLDDHGNQIESACFGIDGKPILSKDGYATLRSKYDERGNVVERAFFGIDEKPARDKDGIAGFRAKYNDRSHRIETAFFDSEGKPALGKDGNAGWRSRYDDRGNEIETSFFGIDEKPVLLKDGYAGWRSKHDDRGNMIETAYFGIDEKPTLSKDGYATLRSKYDDRGNVVERAFFGIDEKPARDKDGIAGFRAKYDDRSHRIETAFFGIEGKPTLGKDGNAGWRSRYDDRGNEIETAFFGIDEKMIFCTDGYASRRSKYDDRGNKIEAAYFGIDEKPLLSKNGYAGWRSKYDDRGNEIETEYFGIDEKPILLKDGYAGWRSTYEGGHWIESTFVDLGGKPALNKSSGRAIKRFEYDHYGRMTKESSFDTDARPVNRRDEGWSYKTLIYDDDTGRVSERFFDARGREVAKATK